MKAANQLPPERIAQIQQLRASGTKVHDIAALVGCSTTTIGQYVHEADDQLAFGNMLASDRQLRLSLWPR